MDRAPDGRAWTKVTAIHAPDTQRAPGRPCEGPVHSYAYRYYPPDSPMYERSVRLSWCGACRSYSGAMVRVPRGRVLVDVLAGLSGPERDRLVCSEPRLVSYLDRLARRGQWPPGGYPA